MTREQKKTQVRELAKGVTRSYPGYDIGLVTIADQEDVLDEVIFFLESNPGCRSDAVLRYIDSLIYEPEDN